MNDLRSELISAYRQGRFLEVVYQKSLGEEDNRGDLLDALINVHNEGLLDVVAGFRTLQNKPATGYDFFLTRYVLEEILPKLNAPVQSVMDCVLRLVKQAGQDGAAGTLFTPFIDYCASEESRPKEALRQIEASFEQFADLLTPTIVAGARIDTEHYVTEAIRLAGHENIEIRKRALFSFGRIKYPEASDLPKRALTCLELTLNKETDDLTLGNLIKSSLGLYKHDKTQENRIIHLIESALAQGGDYALHAASELFAFDFNDLPESLIDSLLRHFLHVQQKNKGTLDNIDIGLVKLFKRDDPTKGVRFIEDLLLSNSKDLSINVFDSTIREVRKNTRSILNKLLTKWMLRGDRVLCTAVTEIINATHDHNMQLAVAPTELISVDLVHIVFIARKTIGYLFYEPITAASIVISLANQTSDDETLQQLSTLLFDPLLLNYPGKVKDYLSQQAKEKTGKSKLAIETALKTLDDYLNDLKSIGVIPELHPSQTQRDAYQQRFSRLWSASYKEAESKSVFANFFTKTVLLYGRKSINYINSPDGQSNRMEIPLNSHGFEMEFARLLYIDPFGLDYMLRIFRAEQLRS